MMNSFSIFKKVLRYYKIMTPHFTIVKRAMGVLVDQGRDLKDLTVLMDITISQLLLARNAPVNINANVWDAKKTAPNFNNCLVPQSMLIKADFTLYTSKIEKFIKSSSSVFPGVDIPIVRDGIPALIKVKKHDHSDSARYYSWDPNSTHIGYTFEEIRDDIIELPKKQNTANTSKMVSDASLKPLQFRESLKRIGLSSQINLKRYMTLKLDGLVSEKLNIKESDNCRVEIRIQVGEYLFTQISKTSNLLTNEKIRTITKA